MCGCDFIIGGKESLFYWAHQVDHSGVLCFRIFIRTGFAYIHHSKIFKVLGDHYAKDSELNVNQFTPA